MIKIKFVGPSQAFTPFGVMVPGEVKEIDEKHYDIARILRGQFKLADKKEVVKKKEAVGKKKVAPAVQKVKEE